MIKFFGLAPVRAILTILIIIKNKDIFLTVQIDRGGGVIRVREGKLKIDILDTSRQYREVTSI